MAAQFNAWGRSVHKIQRMPAAKPRNTDLTMQAIVGKGADRGLEHTA